MFFHKFPGNKLSTFRIGTTGSRHRDCAALMSYGYILDVLGMKALTEFMDWVFIPKVGDEIERIMDNDDELEQLDSYFPYQIDMGLVTKSKYSASMNPHFFCLVHMVGALLRSQRSMSARHICEGQIMNIMLNAGCVAYVYSHTFDISKVFHQSIDAADPPADTDELIQDYDLTDDAIAVLTSKDPNVWVAHLTTNNNQMPLPVRDFMRRVCRGIENPREGTIDAKLKEQGVLL